MASAASARYYRMRLRSYKQPPFPIASDVVRLILGFLNERQRLRFLVTSKTLAGQWLEQRSAAARDAFKQLEAQDNLWISAETKHPRCTYFFEHSIELCPKYAGLLHIHTEVQSIMWTGASRFHDSFSRHFAPWASAFVCTDTPEENPLCEAEEDTVVDDGHESLRTLCAVSQRAF